MTPASIRYKNPGAMWGGNPISKKWGEAGNVSLNDGLGQGNRIAVFPTYVQGICAQIDLWRSPRYHNKRFADAIRVWSGGNWVQSYIDFVEKHAPGMTPDTIMSDQMLNSALGISFLKAQAWHEAGQKYPAPDQDWLDAQAKVFGEPASPPVDVPVVPVPEHDTKWLQETLNTLGANPKLDVDGIVGPALRSAISDFQRKNGLDDDGLVGPATMRELILDLAAVGMPPEIKLPPPGGQGTTPHAELAPTFWGRVLDLFRPKAH
jgi:putative peptidoglycan binding protein